MNTPGSELAAGNQRARLPPEEHALSQWEPEVRG